VLLDFTSFQDTWLIRLYRMGWRGDTVLCYEGRWFVSGPGYRMLRLRFCDFLHYLPAYTGIVFVSLDEPRSRSKSLLIHHISDYIHISFDNIGI
jgi:hypothetical protein